MSHSPSGTPILEVKDLVKHYPSVQAVSGVSFAIQEGRCFGLLGPNGAGKTTTIEMIEGITEPTSGKIYYRGQIAGAEFREKAGIQFQSTALQDFLTVREVLKLFGKFYKTGIQLAELVKLCSLEEFLDRDTHKLSGGQRQRVLLAIALVNDPDILFLDEPTTGLDPQARRNFWDLVRSIRTRGKTIILTTHYMEEAAVLCDEIAIMDRGKMIARGSPEHLLKQRFSGVSIQIPLEDFSKGAPGFEHVLREGCVCFHATEVNETLERLIHDGVSLNRMKLQSETLEDLFLDLTGKELRL